MSQPYASATPSGINYLIDSTLLLEETVLATSNKERDLYESLAELYSIITTLNILERSYLRDSLHEQDKDELYTTTCQRLINQFNAILKDETVNLSFKNLDHFFKEYDIDYNLAKARLEIGIPATMETSVTSSTPSNAQQLKNAPNTRLVAELTGNFITLMDAIKLNYRTKDQLHPLLTELVTNTNKVLFNGDFDGRSRLIQWLIKLNALDINQQLSDDELKEFLYEVDTAYKGFYSCLS